MFIVHVTTLVWFGQAFIMPFSYLSEIMEKRKQFFRTHKLSFHYQEQLLYFL